MKYFSMFSGIGGFEKGIEQAYGISDKQLATIEQDRQGRNRNTNEVGNDVLPTSRTTPLCIGYSEIDKYAIKVYERQFNGHTNYGNATAIDAQQLPDFDLLVGGFPCQAFSIAGKRAGFNDTRGTLFFDIARILKEKQPRHLVLENVKGLLSHDSGRTFTTIIGVLTDLGYLVEWQVLNSKDFGVPQNRERVYIIGHLGNECGRKVFPISGNVSQTIESGLITVSAVTGVKRVELSTTLDTIVEKDNYLIDPPRIRRLTPIECERLQGFPDGHTAYGIGEEVISDTQRYKMCGNAISVPVVEAVIGGLLTTITLKTSERGSHD